CLIHFTGEHADQEMPYFGQAVFLQSEARGPLTDELYQRALDHEMRFARGFAQLFEERGFAALVAPTNAPAWAIDVLDGYRGLGGRAQVAADSGFRITSVSACFTTDNVQVVRTV